MRAIALETKVNDGPAAAPLITSMSAARLGEPAARRRVGTRDRLWLLVLAVGAAGIVAWLAGPASLRPFVGAPFLLLPPVAILVGLYLFRPARQNAWSLMGLGLGAIATASLTFTYAGATRIPIPHPSPVDAVLLGGIVLLIAGFARLIGGRGRIDSQSVIDIAIVVVAFALVAWFVIIDPVADQALSLANITVVLVYPSLILILLTVALRLLLGPGRRSASFWFAIGAILATLVSNLALAVLTSRGEFASGDPWGVGWLLAGLAWAGAALHPSMVGLTESAPNPGPVRVRPARILAMAAAALLAPAILLLDRDAGDVDRLVIGLAAAVLIGLVIARLWRALSELDRNLRDRELLEQQLVQAQRLEAIGRLAGGVAHDFNNLLMAIDAYVSLALRDLPTSHPVASDLGEAREAVRRGAGLTRQLLAFGRRQALDPALVDLDSVVDGLLAMLRRLLPSNIELVRSAGPRSKTVSADVHQLEQVILNLVLNARDAMPDGGRLSLETSSADLPPGAEGHGTVLLSVRDEGVGMAPETLDRIFEPFFTTKGVGKGTGLGLATVYGVVKQSGGDIAVKSQPRRGTTFTVSLPFVAGSVPAPPSGDTARPDADAETILVVDDDDHIRAVTARMLQGLGYRVTTATSGEEALRVATAAGSRIALVLTDIVMPGMGGPTLAARLRSHLPGLPILFCSGYPAGAGAAELALAAGPLLAKPFTVESLRMAVSGALSAQESH
jgi:signal transduction histidine kinase/ActR/RegA family two-component response regulator